MEQHKRNFIRIINCNQGIIKSLCKAYYTSFEDQKDAFQDIVLQLWRSFDNFRGECEISTWIYRVSLNTLLGRARKEKHNIATEPINDVETAFVPAMADSDTELLQLVLRTLQGTDKAIVILFLEGYKHKEIAQMLNLTVTNVSTKLNRVKETLKAKFKNHLHECK